MDFLTGAALLDLAIHNELDIHRGCLLTVDVKSDLQELTKLLEQVRVDDHILWFLYLWIQFSTKNGVKIPNLSVDWDKRPDILALLTLRLLKLSRSNLPSNKVILEEFIIYQVNYPSVLESFVPMHYDVIKNDANSISFCLQQYRVNCPIKGRIVNLSDLILAAKNIETDTNSWEIHWLISLATLTNLPDRRSGQFDCHLLIQKHLKKWRPNWMAIRANKNNFHFDLNCDVPLECNGSIMLHLVYAIYNGYCYSENVGRVNGGIFHVDRNSSQDLSVVPLYKSSLHILRSLVMFPIGGSWWDPELSNGPRQCLRESDPPIFNVDVSCVLPFLLNTFYSIRDEEKISYQIADSLESNFGRFEYIEELQNQNRNWRGGIRVATAMFLVDHDLDEFFKIYRDVNQYENLFFDMTTLLWRESNTELFSESKSGRDFTVIQTLRHFLKGMNYRSYLLKDLMTDSRRVFTEIEERVKGVLVFYVQVENGDRHWRFFPFNCMKSTGTGYQWFLLLNDMIGKVVAEGTKKTALVIMEPCFINTLLSLSGNFDLNEGRILLTKAKSVKRNTV